MLHLLKNPIVFGALVGLILCLLLYAHDKFLNKKTEERSGFSTYAKIFLAGFIATAPLVFLFFNRDLSFSPKKNEKVTSEVTKKVTESIEELTRSSHKASNDVSEFVEEVSAAVEASVSKPSEGSVKSSKKHNHKVPPKMHCDQLND